MSESSVSHGLDVRQRAHWQQAVWPLVGVVALVLLVLSLLIAPCMACALSINDSGTAFARFFGEARVAFGRAAYLTLLATFAFFWFVSYLQREIRQVEGDKGWLAAVAYGGGLVMCAMLLLNTVLILTAQVVGDNSASPEIARLLYAAGFNFGMVYAPPLAALVAATSFAILRSRWLPRPLGWLGLPLVVLSLAWFAPGMGAMANMLWLFLLSLALLWRAVTADSPR
jgi:hypothetical protein